VLVVHLPLRQLTITDAEAVPLEVLGEREAEEETQIKPCRVEQEAVQ